MKTKLIKVKVKPNSKTYRVEQLNKEEFVVFVKEKAEKGKANKAVIRLLADFFGISSSNIRIIRGVKSREKVIEIGK